MDDGEPYNPNMFDCVEVNQFHGQEQMTAGLPSTNEQKSNKNNETTEASASESEATAPVETQGQESNDDEKSLEDGKGQDNSKINECKKKKPRKTQEEATKEVVSCDHTNVAIFTPIMPGYYTDTVRENYDRDTFPTNCVNVDCKLVFVSGREANDGEVKVTGKFAVHACPNAVCANGNSCNFAYCYKCYNNLITEQADKAPRESRSGRAATSGKPHATPRKQKKSNSPASTPSKKKAKLQ